MDGGGQRTEWRRKITQQNVVSSVSWQCPVVVVCFFRCLKHLTHAGAFKSCFLFCFVFFHNCLTFCRLNNYRQHNQQTNRCWLESLVVALGPTRLSKVKVSDIQDLMKWTLSAAYFYSYRTTDMPPCTFSHRQTSSGADRSPVRVFVWRAGMKARKLIMWILLNVEGRPSFWSSHQAAELCL